MCFHYIFFISCAWIFHDDHFVSFFLHFMCISDDHFVSHQGILILATLTAIPFCSKNWNVDYICRSFWKLNFPAKPKSKPKPQLNQNNHYPGLLSYTRHPPTPSKMIFFTKYSNFIMDFCYQKKWSQFMIIRFHSANFY